MDLTRRSLLAGMLAAPAAVALPFLPKAEAAVMPLASGVRLGIDNAPLGRAVFVTRYGRFVGEQAIPAEWCPDREIVSIFVPEDASLADVLLDRPPFETLTLRENGELVMTPLTFPPLAA